MRKVALILSWVFLYGIALAQEYDFTVAKDGSGDFLTVQEAIDAVPHLRKNRTVILIKSGVYKERLILPTTKTNVTFIGEGAEKTVLTYDDYASKPNRFGENMGTSGSSSFYINGDGFEAYNITFENSSGPVGQAVAVRVDGDKVKFENCRFLGFQDTLYPHGKNSRQYYKNCYIEGTVDFIFGWSTAYFEGCEIFCKSPGYVTAASTEQESEYGFVFRNCKISGSADKGSVYLGRPWRPYAQTVFINCEMSEVINRAGWDPWGSEEKKKTAYYAEHGSKGKGGKVNERVDWSFQLSADELDKYTVQKVLGGWDPNSDSGE
ncbi:pectinesterase family protein [Marinoscillum sp. MHG1-6]|uniref:pectinesterase family protein n=1 Tax=Marinoscillum sp. MHG1-6 TaxID=2959627 RepID=UPI0021583093|nr:pectinesterase family protein [Marinoscillum sp. MHG1-6]